LPACSCPDHNPADPGPAPGWTIARSWHREDRAPARAAVEAEGGSHPLVRPLKPIPNADEAERRAAAVGTGAAWRRDRAPSGVRPGQQVSAADSGNLAPYSKVDWQAAAADILPLGSHVDLDAPAAADLAPFQTKHAGPDRLRAGAVPATRWAFDCRGSATSSKSPRNTSLDRGPSNRESSASNPAPRRPV